MKFSICVPTRGRPNNVKRLVDSIYNTASNPKSIEIIFRIDDDDKPTRTMIESLAERKIITGKRPKFLSDLWEECYPHAIADRVMMCADDVVFKTEKWDSIISSKTPDPKNNLYFIWGNDLNQRRGLATLPIMSRAWIDNVSYFVPKGYICDWCDTHIHDIANKLADLGIDVRCYFGDIIFEHMHPTIGKAESDEIYQYRRIRSEGNQYGMRNAERIELSQKLYNLINTGKLKAGKIA